MLTCDHVSADHIIENLNFLMCMSSLDSYDLIISCHYMELLKLFKSCKLDSSS